MPCSLTLWPMVSFCAFAGNIATSANAIANNMWSIRFISFAKKIWASSKYPYTKLLLKNNRRKGNAFILINNGLLKRFLRIFGCFMSILLIINDLLIVFVALRLDCMY